MLWREQDQFEITEYSNGDDSQLPGMAQVGFEASWYARSFLVSKAQRTMLSHALPDDHWDQSEWYKDNSKKSTDWILA